MKTFTFMGRSYTLPAPGFEDIETSRLASAVSEAVPPSADFVESVRQFGVVQPPVVVYDGGHLRVIDGRRRVTAASKAGIQRLSCMVYPAGQDVTADVLAVLLNEQRGENALAEFMAILRMIDHGATERQISETTGMPVARIRRRLKLCRLIGPLMQAFQDGRISPAVAEGCSALSESYQRDLAEQLERKGRLTLADLRDVRSARRSAALKASPGLAQLISAVPAQTDAPALPADQTSATISLAAVMPLLSDQTRSAIEADLRAAAARGNAVAQTAMSIFKTGGVK